MTRQQLDSKARSCLPLMALWVCIVPTSTEIFSRPVAESLLEPAPEGKVWVRADGKIRIHFVGSEDKGFDVAFEAKEGETWSAVAAFPQGKVWALYNQWNAQAWDRRWYSGEHGFRALQVRASSPAELECLGRGEVSGQPWEFSDLYSFENGAIKIVRRWHHASAQRQSPITLVTALRLPVGEDPRVLVPGVLYNDNPGAYPTRQVPHLPQVPFARGLYEEHRLPVPFVNLESTVARQRTYASLLSAPSKVPHGHNGVDQWWSLGLQWRWEGEVDLLLVSGAVANNGMNSIVYGHLNGFDPYDDAYVDVAGDVTIEKTFYVDLGLAPRKGYAFRETLWKAYTKIEPRVGPFLSFAEAMNLQF